MRSLILHTSTNKPGKRDGDEFTREARAAHNATWSLQDGISWSDDVLPIRCDVPADERRSSVATSLAEIVRLNNAPRDIRPPRLTPLKSVALFCHGTTRTLQWYGAMRSLTSSRTLAEQISCVADVKLPLFVAVYACSAGSPGGWVEKLARSFDDLGMRVCVYGHETVGHTTRNPYVRVYDALEGHRVHGGAQWLIAPNSPLWSAWKLWLNEGTNRFRLMHDEPDTIRRAVMQKVGLA